MTHSPIFHRLLLLAGFILAIGIASDARAQTANATHPKVNKQTPEQSNKSEKSAPSGGSVALLDDAYATLAQGKHDYDGHRVRAMKQIELALGEAGGKVSGRGRNLESQGTSDAQLRAARGLLQEASASLSKKALRHTDMAIEQLNTALAIK